MVPEPFPIPLENPNKKPIPKSVHDPDGDGTLKRVEEARKMAKEETIKKNAKAKAPQFETAKLPETKTVCFPTGQTIEEKVTWPLDDR